MATLTILLNRGPLISEYAELALKLAGRAADKGHRVNLYCYIDGVWAPHVKADKGYENEGRLLREALAKGVQVKICARCAEARDVTAEDTVPGIPQVGLFDFITWLKESDKVLTFTG